MKHCVWRLLTAIFILVTALALGLMALICQDIPLLLGIGFYGMMICIPWGILKGVLAVIDYHKTCKEEV